MGTVPGPPSPPSRQEGLHRVENGGHRRWVGRAESSKSIKQRSVAGARKRHAFAEVIELVR